MNQWVHPEIQKAYQTAKLGPQGAPKSPKRAFGMPFDFCKFLQNLQKKQNFQELGNWGFGGHFGTTKNLQIFFAKKVKIQRLEEFYFFAKKLQKKNFRARKIPRPQK